ncbi:ion transporter [Xylariaceae sp. FL0016]|nr:ion transporter [Xylariaceae sp. FL0016]
MSDNTPLLARPSTRETVEGSLIGRCRCTYSQLRKATQRFFSSRWKHLAILTLIVLDVAGILTDIFIALITCELGRNHEPWVAPTRGALTTFSLVMSCTFMIELVLSVFAEGIKYFSSWFHCFDAFIIVASFAVDLLEHGVEEQIASLIVILRLWRFVKIIQEFSVEQSEQTEELRKRIDELETQKADLEAQLNTRHSYG